VAARRGIALGWREHARIGIPVTLVSLVIAAICMALRST
jgi:Na+/H+ antiporter NhaD/arsenite permease-like protein